MITEPNPEEQFYAKALATLSGPRRRTAVLMRICSIVYWILMSAGVGWLFWQVSDRASPIDRRTQTLLSAVVVPGDTVRVRYTLRRNRICATDVSWTEIDGAGEVHRFGPVHVPIPGKPGPDTLIHSWPTAPSAAPGPSVLRVALEYRCPGNYLQGVYPVTEALEDLHYETAPTNAGAPVPKSEPSFVPP